ncbi:MAG: phosphoribosyl-AMP cyclohydrolase [Pseudomonadota bacterium]
MQIDETTELHVKWNADGLIAAIAQDHETKEILMLAWMNEEALNNTLETGEAHYWSRSRQELWHKGATSGNIQKVHSILIDCDQDAVILMVDQSGSGACHTGRPSCFYRTINEDKSLSKDN